MVYMRKKLWRPFVWDAVDNRLMRHFGEGPLLRPRKKWECSIKMDLKDILCEDRGLSGSRWWSRQFVNFDTNGAEVPTAFCHRYRPNSQHVPSQERSLIIRNFYSFGFCDVKLHCKTCNSAHLFSAAALIIQIFEILAKYLISFAFKY